MKRKFSYSIGEMNRRLLAIGRPIRKYLVISTLSSIIGALSHMGLMGFGALWLLAAAGFCRGTVRYAVLTVTCAVLIALCRYLEGVFSHLGAYGILAKMRVHLFDAIDRIAPAYLIGRETGDVMNIAVSDIETLEFFFAHTIGPMFTVILLPVTTVVLAYCVNPLYAWVLIPIYLMISVVLPFAALKAGRGIGMRYRERLGVLKSKILESVYSIRDIQIFGAGERRLEEVSEANDRVNRAALGLTLHRQTIASFPSFFVYLARILILVCAGVLASQGIDEPVGTIALSFAATASLSSTFNLTFVVTSLLETYAAADRATIAIIRQCHQDAKQILSENRELLDKIAAYLLKKETITGQEMMAIIEGRDPETVDNYGATREEDQKLFRPSTPDVIEAPAKHINIVSEPIPMPDFDSQPEDKPEDKPEEKPQEDPQPEDSQGKE